MLATHMRRHDWSSTSLGIPEHWPEALRSTVRILLTSRYQMWMGWGKDLAFLYNDAYCPTLGVKHPWAIGQPAAVVWREIWSEVGPLAEQVMSTGEATYNEGMQLFLERSGFPEETYHTFSYSPLFDDDGTVAGLFCVVVEETERIIGARRLATLRELAAASAHATQQAALFATIAAQLSANAYDLPFALIYIFDADGRAHLAAASGIDADHAAAPRIIEPQSHPWHDRSREGGALQRSAEAELVGDLAFKFGALPTGAWNQPPRAAQVVPIAQQGSHGPAGFFVAAINPHRPLDAAYRDFVGLIANQIANAVVSVRSFELERERAEALAAIDRAKTTFFSNVSHEFRTPLALMLGPLEELLEQRPRTPDQVRTQAQLAHRNGMRLLRLVNSLLDFSRIEAGRMQASYQATALDEFSAEIATTFRSVIEAAGLTLTVDVAPLPQPVYVDRALWEQILLNLLSNAFKYTLGGGITVTLRAAAQANTVDVAVTDTGIGIPAAELPRLFERFHRVEGA
jgi:signal transduction histidine kinase